VSDMHQRRARRDAEKARSKAFWHNVTHSLRGIPNELLPFSAVRDLHPAAERYGGVKPIPIQQIVGSVDRYRDFDHYFLPRVGHTIERWAGIRQANLEGKELPPISVYKVGEVYFVKDGHHRVSVARNAGQKYIDAEIIELSVTVPPNSTDTLKEIIIKGEYADFLETTQLSRVRPDHYEILFTVTGRYDVLLDHIKTRQYYLGLKYQREVAWEEAVGSWYDRLYKRVVDESREHRVLDRFPGRTEADLYLWIMDHRYYLREKYGQDVGSERAATDFATRYAGSSARRAWQRALVRWRGGRLPSPK
jgi:uncharacterized ParB-like nuclease family protein